VTAQSIIKVLERNFEEGLLMFKDLAIQQPDKLTFQTKETIFLKLLDIVGM
jgi:hypothetical protein